MTMTLRTVNPTAVPSHRAGALPPDRCCVALCTQPAPLVLDGVRMCTGHGLAALAATSVADEY